ncbi:MAG: hypothetical protein M3450_02420, partial [Actinomycetota bacterium]|nr:hypothetical protein [Actinomycetota bacterium]
CPFNKGRLYLSHQVRLGHFGRSPQGEGSGDPQQSVVSRKSLRRDTSEPARACLRKPDQLTVERGHRLVVHFRRLQAEDGDYLGVVWFSDCARRIHDDDPTAGATCMFRRSGQSR